MKLACVLLTSALFVVLTISAAGQPTTGKPASSKIEAEILKFMEGYGDDLRANRSKETADRYDRRGAYILMHGRKMFKTFDVLQKEYGDRKNGLSGFAWKDITIETLSPKAALVNALFVVTDGTKELPAATYTGLFVKIDGQWRIRVEHESFPERK